MKRSAQVPHYHFESTTTEVPYLLTSLDSKILKSGPGQPLAVQEAQWFLKIEDSNDGLRCPLKNDPLYSRMAFHLIKCVLLCPRLCLESYRFRPTPLSYMTNAEDHSEFCRSDWTWQRLESLTLVSQLHGNMYMADGVELPGLGGVRWRYHQDVFVVTAPS